MFILTKVYIKICFSFLLLTELPQQFYLVKMISWLSKLEQQNWEQRTESIQKTTLNNSI